MFQTRIKGSERPLVKTLNMCQGIFVLKKIYSRYKAPVKGARSKEAQVL